MTHQLVPCWQKITLTNKLVKTKKKNYDLVSLSTLENLKYVKVKSKAPPMLKEITIKGFRKYHNVFAWNTNDLKGIPTSIAKHKIDIRPNAIPTQQ